MLLIRSLLEASPGLCPPWPLFTCGISFHDNDGAGTLGGQSPVSFSSISGSSDFSQSLLLMTSVITGFPAISCFPLITHRGGGSGENPQRLICLGGLLLLSVSPLTSLSRPCRHPGARRHYHGTAALVFGSPSLAPKHKGSDAGNSEPPERSHGGPPFREKVQVLDLMSHFAI